MSGFPKQNIRRTLAMDPLDMQEMQMLFSFLPMVAPIALRVSVPLVPSHRDLFPRDEMPAFG